jgi:hypothetical protein
MIKENHIGKLILDYQLVDLKNSPDNPKQMLSALRSFSRDDIYKAFVTDEPALLEETIQNHLMKDTTNTPTSQTSLKYRIFQDLSLALDWLKSI